jgi:uncharacterized membrane protein
MASLTTFSVYVLGSSGGAEQVLRVAENQYDRGTLGVDDIAAVTWPREDRRPTTWQESTLGLQPLSGAFWGLFFGVALLLPLLGARTRRADGLLDALGLGDDLLDRTTATIVPGASAVVLVSTSTPTGRLGEALARPAVQRIAVTLDVGHTSRLRYAFGADPGDQKS